MASRDVLRQKAKKQYKELVKTVPKKQRLPFAQFFKQFKDAYKHKQTTDPAAPGGGVEDFNFENMVNVNMIDDESLEEIDDNIEVAEKDGTLEE